MDFGPDYPGALAAYPGYIGRRRKFVAFQGTPSPPWERGRGEGVA